jgi:iron complex outermembrane receptor protein
VIGKHLRFPLYLLLLSTAFNHAGAQNLNDTLNLKEFEVVASYPVNNTGFKKVRMDSALLLPNINADLSTILSQYSTIFIKSYGNGSLATPSFRGTSAHHTQVEWNGITLNSPMLGQLNLSQVPVSQFDGIEILYGAAGLANTSGAFGGVINLVSEPDWNNMLNVLLAQTVASFGTYTTNVNAAAGTRSFQSITKGNYTTSRNDFPYYNDYTGTEMEQINGSYYQYGLSEDLFFRLKEKHFLTAKVWYSNSYTNIPPITTNVDSTHYENQKDEALRSIAEYKYLAANFNISARSAFISQAMRYRNDSLDSRHNSYSMLNRLKMNYLGFEGLVIRPGIDINYDWVISDEYAEKKNRLTSGLFSEFIYDIAQKVKLSLILREDLVDGSLMPFVFGTGIQYKPLKKVNLSFSGNVSRNYRYPTLNDLYWDLYGNPDLKPEKSFSVEGGGVYNFLAGGDKFFLETELTGYGSWITDMIVWMQSESNSYIWNPENVNEVFSRGLETGLNMKYAFQRVTFGMKFNYNYCRSTYEKVSEGSEDAIGKQLRYVPENTFNGTFNAGYRGFYFSWNLTYTSRRYTGSDNETYMPGYNLSNIFFGKDMRLKKFVLSLQLEINNLFDLDYQSIANRPMPGRNYAVTLRGSFTR